MMDRDFSTDNRSECDHAESFDTGVDAGRNDAALKRAEPGRAGRLRVRSLAARSLAAVLLVAFAALLPKGAKGRPPVGLEVMLRIYFMQQWFGHSDPGMENALHDNIAMRRLARVAQGGQRQETDVRGRFVQSQEQPHSCSRRASLRGGQAPLGLPQDALPRVAQERGAGLYAVCAGEFLHGAQEIDSGRGIGTPGRPVLRRPGCKTTANWH